MLELSIFNEEFRDDERRIFWTEANNNNNNDSDRDID